MLPGGSDPSLCQDSSETTQSSPGSSPTIYNLHMNGEENPLVTPEV